MGTKAYKCNIAYTLGATGKGVTLGVMDSDALLSHPELGDGGIIALKISWTPLMKSPKNTASFKSSLPGIEMA